jgi:predicted kinase
LCGAAERETLHLLRERFAVARAACAPRFEERRLAGRAVDGHGDLHLDHVFFESDAAEPLVIDCLEFSAGLRRIDGASDVAFVAMDMAYRGRRDLGERFLRCYARDRGDEGLFGVVDFFAGYRAAVRAKVAALTALDAEVEPQQRDAAAESAARHLSLAASQLEPLAPCNLVLVGGVVGTGKSTVAEALAEELAGDRGAVVIASDRVRRRIHGARNEELEAGSDRYTPAARARIYDELLALARTVLGSGRVVILDATWSRRSDRARARALASEFGVRCRFIETRCGEQTTLRRLSARAARGDSLSDAGPLQYASSIESFEPRGSEEADDWKCLSTDAGAWPEELPGCANWVQR